MRRTTSRRPAGDRSALVLDLAEQRACDPAVAGTKAATLARLAADGFPVPAGVVVTTAACDAVLASAGIDVATATPGQVADATVPDELRSALASALARLGDRSLAVRSSAAAEDLPDASYAGQYATVLGARGIDEVIPALLHCLASAFSDRVAAYRGDDEPSPGVAVLVQELVDPEAAGVAFTANPLTGEDEVLVSAVRGLGDRLVDGGADPDEWVVRGETAVRLAAPEQALDAAAARRVADLARSVANNAGAPQDVEWALAAGQLHLLQARPITALPRRPQITPPSSGHWMKDTTHLSGPTSPLAASAYLPRLQSGMAAAFDEFGILLDGFDVRVIGWEVYVRPKPPGGRDGPAPPAWLLAVLARLAPPLRRRLTAARRAVEEDLAARHVERWWSRWRRELQDELQALRAVDLDGLDGPALADHLDRTLDLLERGLRLHFRLFVPYAMALHELAAAGDELLGWDVPQALELLGGLSETAAAPTRSLADLAEDLRGRSDVLRLLESWSPAQPADPLLAALEETAPDVAAALRDHLHRYGCRLLGYDVALPTVAERPELTLALLRDLTLGDAPGTDPLRTRRTEAAERAARALDGADRRRFDDALARARSVWPVREDNLFFTDEAPNALLRHAALAGGRLLRDQGVLARPDDAVWLHLDELRGALTGSASLDAPGELVARRRAEHAWVRAHPGPQTYGSPPAEPPDLRRMPAEVRRTTGALLWLAGLEYRPDGQAGSSAALRGAPGSPGRYTGPVRIVHDESGFDQVRAGDVLVCPIATSAWSVLFARLGALITDGGGVLAHAAVVAREHALPAVLATGTATSALRDGQLVTVDGSAGTVEMEEPMPTTDAGGLT